MRSVPWALLPVSFQIPRQEPPPLPPTDVQQREMLPFWTLLLSLKNFQSTTPQVPNRPLQRQTPFSRAFFYILSLRAALHVPQQGPYGQRSFISRANGLFIHLYLSQSPIRSSPMKNRENIWSPSMEPHVDGRPTYNEVRPGSPRGPLMTLRSLPQCHAAFSTIPSTLAWVDQSPVSQHVL